MSFGTAPYFALVTLRTSDGALEELEILVNPYATLGKARGICVAK
jgi:predicted Fe-Mo cluster-binding NifX family protein